MNLDVKTIIFLNAIAAFVMGISILVTAHAHPKIKGVTKWAWGCGAQSVAWILIFLQGQIPIFFSTVLAFTLLLLSMMFFYQALSDYKEKNFIKILFYPFIVVAFVLFLIFTEIYPNSLARILTIAVPGMILAFLCSYLLFFKDKAKPTVSERIMGLGFFLIGLTPIITLVSIFSNQIQFLSSLPQSLFRNLTFALIFVSLLILTMSFMLMINDKFMGEIYRLATLDSLTEIYNRAAMERLINTEIDRSKRYGLPMSLLLLDLDHFKKVNDNYGHQVGDFTLKTFVETVTKVLREHDILGRFGGEEFTILLPDTDLVNAHIVAERVRDKVEKTPINVGSISFTQTISIGFSTLNLKNDDFQELFRRADLGLYKAKQTGRNRSVAVRDRNIEIDTFQEPDSGSVKQNPTIDIFKSNPNLDIPSIPKRDLRD